MTGPLSGEADRQRNVLAERLGASVVVTPLCDLCPRITPALVGACASVGIEHGRTTGEELRFYMESVHQSHAEECSMYTASRWSPGAAVPEDGRCVNCGRPRADHHKEAALCTMCEQEPATTTWGLPVCQPCADGLDETQQMLAEEEAADPHLAELGQRVEDLFARFLAERDAVLWCLDLAGMLSGSTGDET